MVILVVGGNGGIGLAMTEHLLHAFPDATIHATYRVKAPQLTDENLTWHQVDVAVETEISDLSQRIECLDWLVNCVGRLQTDQCGPEKSIRSFDPDFFIQNLTINTLPTLLLAKHFTPILQRSSSPKLITLSARVGSIADNQLGGWYSYRSSKAALNMVIKTLSIEWQRSVKHGTVLALHPGTTDTPLSKPFQSNVPDGKLFRAEKVAHDLVNIITNATPLCSGQFFAYDGSTIPW